MTRSDVSLLAVRILALYLVVQGISHLPAVVSLLRVEGEFIGEYRVAYSAAMTAPIVLGFAMFALSSPIARWLLPPEATPDEPAAGMATIQSAAIGTFGLFLIAFAIPQLWAAALQFKQNVDPLQPKAFYADPFIVAELGSLVLGVVLLTGARYWARLVAKFRDLGYEDDST